MHTLHLNYSDRFGGAARAAYRLHRSLIDIGVESRMKVAKKETGDWTVEGPDGNIAKGLTAIKTYAGMKLCNVLKTENPIIHTLGILPSRLPQWINKSSADIVHLHWIGGEMISIEGIGKIKKPLVWTLHDMWAFCGAEHLSSDFRWRDGYLKSNRPETESGFDLNRFTWNRKRKNWPSSMTIVTPSAWLAGLAQESVLFREHRIETIPNPIDLEVWKPVDKTYAKSLLGLSDEMPLLLFGAAYGKFEHHKGFDLLLEALAKLSSDKVPFQLAIFGFSPPKEDILQDYPVYWAGALSDDLSLRILYSAADAFLLPSRVDNFPNTAVEAHACGTPVVGFDVCGVPEIVSHKETGWLAKPFDTTDFADGIKWVVEKHRVKQLAINAHEKAVKEFSADKVARVYSELYQRVLEE